MLTNSSMSKTSGKVSLPAQVNTYLQSWSPNLHTTSKLPKDIIQMMKTGQKFHVSLEALKLSDLVWYHLGTGQHVMSLNNQSASKCLRDNYIVKTVGDLVQNIKQERDPSFRHSNRLNCTCEYCKNDRQQYGCAAPNKCCLMARKLLDQLQPKWHPFNLPHLDNLTHTPNRRLANEAAHKNNGTILFNPSVTSNDSLSQNFHVFTDSNAKYSLIEEHAKATCNQEDSSICSTPYYNKLKIYN